jgi:hypothetical protein
MDLASLAARLLPCATGPTCIFMQRHPRDERPHMPHIALWVKPGSSLM